MKKLLVIVVLLYGVCSAQTRMDASSQLAFRAANDGTTGTTVNQIAKINSSGNAVNAGTTDTSIPVYVVVGGAGTTGVAQLAIGGAVTCLFDASGGTSGHYVQVSGSTAGTCHDAGSTIPTSGWVMGTLLTSPAANSTGSVLLVQGYLASTGGGGFTGGTLTSELTLAAATTGAASMNIPSGTAPTTPAAGDCWRDANGINCVENTSANGSYDFRSDLTGAVGPANTVRYTGDSNVAKVSENGGALQELLQLSKTQSPTNKTFDCTNKGTWCLLGTSTVSSNAVVSITATTAKKHCMCRLLIGGYAGGGGVARGQFGNTNTVDTGTNYAFGGFNITSGTSTAPTVTGVGSGSTAQNGVPVSGSTTTAGRFVKLDISNPGAVIKYFTIETSGVGASAAVTPNLAYIAGTWNNTTTGVGLIQFTACTTTTGTCTTVNFTTATLTCWGRDDN